MSDAQNAASAQYQSLRMQSLLETVTAQRNDAQNAVANLTADKSMLTRALQETVEANNRINAVNAELTQKVADLQQALSDAHAALRGGAAGEKVDEPN